MPSERTPAMETNPAEETGMPHPIEIDYKEGRLTVTHNTERRSVQRHGHVEWTSTERVGDWRVIFGPYAPVVEQSKVASPNNRKLKLTNRRPEDLGHWKYVVVATPKNSPNKIDHLDPELIVDP